MMIFVDRRDAGLRLAVKLVAHPLIKQSNPQDLLVLSIPRGGVIVGDVIARYLKCIHDVLIVKKVGFPGYEEFAIGAIAEDGTILLNQERIKTYHLKNVEINASIAKAQYKVQQYIKMFRQGKHLSVAGKTVILVDDGIATGETVKVALHWLKEERQHAAKIFVAIPVGPPDSLIELQMVADKVISLHSPPNFRAVSQYYRNFAAVEVDEVLEILSHGNYLSEHIEPLI